MKRWLAIVLIACITLSIGPTRPLTNAKTIPWREGIERIIRAAPRPMTSPAYALANSRFPHPVIRRLRPPYSPAVVINPNEGILWSFTNPAAAANYTGPCTAGWIVSTTTTAARTLASPADACRIIPVNCVLDACGITLPSGAFTQSTQIVLQNTSNASVVPINKQGGAYWSAGTCNSGCTAQSFGFTVSRAADAIVISANFCASSCATNATPPTVTSITDTAGNSATCAFVAGQSWTTNPNVRDELWVCPNAVIAGADTWTVTLSGTGYFLRGGVAEFSGVNTSTPTEVANAGTANAATWSLAASGNPTVRNDVIYASTAAEGTGNGITVGQNNIASTNQQQGEGDQYWPSSGGNGQTPVMTWSQSGTAGQTAQVIAALIPATPLSYDLIQPTAPSTIYGAPVDGSGNLPLMPGAAVLLTVDAAGNYEAQYLTPPQGAGMVDEVYASAWAPGLTACYKTVQLTAWVAAQVATIPSLVPGCVINLIQGGSQAPQIVPGSGVQMTDFPSGFQHLAGRGAAAFVEVGGGGNVDIFGGQLAQ